MRKHIALAVALALSSTLAVAAGGTGAGSAGGSSSGGASGSTGTGASTGATGSGQSGVTGSGQTGVTGGATGGGQVGAESSMGATLTPQAFWDKHSKDGNLAREDAMKFKSPDGRPLDVQRLDANNDGRISQTEWTSFHSSTGAAGRTGTTPPPGEPAGGSLTSPRGGDPAGGGLGSPSRTPQPTTPATPASPSTR